MGSGKDIIGDLEGATRKVQASTSYLIQLFEKTKALKPPLGVLQRPPDLQKLEETVNLSAKAAQELLDKADKVVASKDSSFFAFRKKTVQDVKKAADALRHAVRNNRSALQNVAGAVRALKRS